MRYEVEECEYCGGEVAVPWMEQHQNDYCEDAPAVPYKEDAVQKYIPNVEPAPYYVYVCLVVSSGKQFFYVGMTREIEQRVRSHLRNYERITIPHGGEMKRRDYQLIGVNKTVTAETKERARYIERQTFLNVAEVVGGDMVCGGL